VLRLFPLSLATVLSIKPVQLDQIRVGQNLKTVGISEQFDASDAFASERPEQLTIAWWS